jgi:hypothetical protein
LAAGHFSLADHQSNLVISIPPGRKAQQQKMTVHGDRPKRPALHSPFEPMIAFKQANCSNCPKVVQTERALKSMRQRCEGTKASIIGLH